MAVIDCDMNAMGTTGTATSYYEETSDCTYYSVYSEPYLDSVDIEKLHAKRLKREDDQACWDDKPPRVLPGVLKSRPRTDFFARRM